MIHRLVHRISYRAITIRVSVKRYSVVIGQSVAILAFSVLDPVILAGMSDGFARSYYGQKFSASTNDASEDHIGPSDEEFAREISWLTKISPAFRFDLPAPANPDDEGRRDRTDWLAIRDPDVPIPAPQRVSRFREADVRCIAEMIRSEANGSSTTGMAGVAWTVLHRQDWPGPKKSACDLISEPNQYTRRPSPLPEHISVARGVLTRTIPDPTGGATHFYAPARVKAPYWAKLFPHTAMIEGHSYHKGSRS